MFAKPRTVPAAKGETSALPAPLAALAARPKLAAGAAGGLFLLCAAALALTLGDPHAGVPVARVSLTPEGRTPVAGATHAPGAEAAAAGEALIVLPGEDGPIPGGALPAGAIPALLQPGPGGALPVIAPDGRTAAKAYARPFRDDGRPKVALVIGGLGLDPKRTREAIETLPGEVTLSFVPYAEGLQGWIDLARANGHEVLLEAPMEPADYPENDPGPYTLLASSPPAETQRRMTWLMGRATGYIGVTNYLGARFLSSDGALGGFADTLRARGLAFIDDGQAAGRAAGPPRASADKVIDEQLSADGIDRSLLTLEANALRNGRALGAGFAYPVTLELVRRWAAGLDGRGYQLAPASALLG